MEGWGKVPDVLLLNVYSHLSFRDKLSASSTCKQWRELLFHPCNWPANISFYYLKSDRITHSSHNHQRENFLKVKTAHFLNSCSVQLPIEEKLFVTSCDTKQGQENVSDVESLMHHLCYNKNLSQLTIVQAQSESQCKAQGKSSSSLSSLIQSPCHSDFCLEYVRQHGIHCITERDNSDFSEEFTHNNILVSTSSYTGAITRSKRQRMQLCLENSMHKNSQNCYTDSSLNYVDHDEIRNTELQELFECNRKNAGKFSTMSGRKNTRMQLVDYIKRIIVSANSLSHLSFGCLSSLTQHNSEIVENLKSYQSCSMRSLHISRCQESLESVYQPIDRQDLLMLKNLQHLSLDTEDLSDELLVSLTEGGRAKLGSLALTMFKHKEGRRQIRDRTWDLVHQSFPDLVLTLNLVRCPDAIRDMMTVINPSMPLTHLRILFCDEFYVSGLHHVARHQAPTLQSLQIIESMREGPMFYDIGVDEQDPFVMMAWRCKKLSVFSVIGVALREHDVLAVARLRGMQLTRFEVLDECITAFDHGESEFEEDFSMSFETFCEEISTSLGQAWVPRTEEDIDDSIYYGSAECQTFLPILMKDQQSQLLC